MIPFVNYDTFGVKEGKSGTGHRAKRYLFKGASDATMKSEKVSALKGLVKT